ncbi:hypothetical protein OROHE_022645 [Orobanche hederae]
MKKKDEEEEDLEKLFSLNAVSCSQNGRAVSYEYANDHFTNGCSKERSHEDAYIIYGSQTRYTTYPHIHQLNHHQQHDPYHVPSPQPPPYGWSHCCLTIEGDDKALQNVVNGQVFIPSTTEVLSAHGPPMPPGHCRVTIVEDILPNALVPCSNDEIRYVSKQGRTTRKRDDDSINTITFISKFIFS